jgi:hypothetical protein
MFGPKMARWLAGTLMLLWGQAGMAGVVVGGSEWRQLTDTVSISYGDLVDSGTCSASSGLCNGSFNAVDFSGWTWATVEEVGLLFETLTGLPAGTFASPENVNELGSTWAPAAIDVDGSGPDTGAFHKTFQGTAGAMIQGLTRSAVNVSGSLVYAPWIQDRAGDDYAYTAQSLSSGAGTASNEAARNVNVGVWLYRNPASMVDVPLPIWLLLAGIPAARMARRKRVLETKPA